jgi:hypothetical protein
MKRVSLYLIMVLILTNIGLAKSTTGTIGTSSVTCWDGIPPQVPVAFTASGYATVSQANSFWATTVSFDYVTVGDGAEAWSVDIAGITYYLQVSTSGHLVTKNYNGSVSNGSNLYLISILSLEDEGMKNNTYITVTATISGTYYITPDLPIISGNNQTICPTATASVSVTNPDPDGGVYWSDGSTSASRNLSPGTYYVRNTGGGLNSSYETVNVNSYTAPGVTNPSNPSAVCAGTGAPSFSVTGSGTGISYQWYQFNGSSWSSLGAASGIYSGTQTSSLTITAPTYSMNGYLYKCTVSGTCSPTATSNTASLTVYTMPTLLATTSASSIAATSATSGGNISSNGGTSVTEHGICWNTASNPTTGNSKTTLGAFATGSYTSGLTGLTQNTLYYVRAYATNTCGTSYGTEISFTSISKAPTVDVASNVTKNTMRATWNAPTSQGSESFTYTLEVDDNNSFSSPAQYTGLNAEYYDIVGLSTYTLYYYRVKAVNAGGNSAWSSTTSQRTDPNWSKISISGGSGILKNDGATTNGGADNIGYISMTQVSTFQYNVSFTFTTDNCCFSNTSGTHVKLFYWNAATSSWSPVYSDNRGAGGPYSPSYNTVDYTHNISALAQQGTYYFRASIIDKASSGEYMTGNYGCNYCGSDGWGANHYDNADISFTLSDMDPPIVSTTSVNTVTKVSAFGTGNITSIGSQACSNRGFSFRSDSTGAGEIDQSGSYGTGSFSSSITGLTSNTKYDISAYATNNGGQVYGSEITITTLPDVTGTSATSQITQTTATLGSTVSRGGGVYLSARGVCWSTSSTPTIANSKTTDATNFISTTALASQTQPASLTGLTSNTKYYVRAYATNTTGTTYGPEVIFTTLADVTGTKTPTFETAEINETSATSGGTIATGGNQSLSSRGVCWSTSSNPTTANPKTSDATTLGSEIQGALTSLTPNTKYYIRAYAINAGGTSYGPEIYFTTRAHVSSTKTPTFETAEITEVSATSGGTVDNGGSQPLASRGVCWSTSSSPTTADPKTSNTTTLGSEVLGSLTSLTPNTKYYIRAYSINAGGTTYGPEIYFTTRAHVSATKTPSINEIVEKSALSGSTILSGGSQPLSSRGVCWSTSPNPTVPSNNKTTDLTTTFDSQVGTIIDESSTGSVINNTKYYVRAYSINAGGTTYGPEIYFTTKANCYISTLTGVTSDSCFVSGAIAVPSGIQGGTELVSERGFVWSNTAASPTVTTSLSSFKKQVGNGYGTIPSTVLKFQVPSETYFVRSYSINAGGTNYSNTVAMTTSLNTPYNGVGSISLNFIHNSGWEDNNSSNTDPSVPNNLSAPADISSDSDFPKDENLGGQGDWKSWEFNGNSQCFQLPYNSSTNRVNNNSQKALFLYFRTSTTTANTPISSRQVLLELGGESSGMNAYIYSGKVWVGIWNSSQRRFFSKSIAVDQTYLLNIEFNGTKVRTALNGECSSSMLFSGFASNSNYNGIGASVNGTRYMDLTRTSGVNDYYKGRLAEVLMFNDCSEILRLIIMNFFDNKYDKNYRSNYTSYFGKVSAETGWEEYESEVSPFDNNEESSIQKLEVFKSVKDLSINLNIDEDENIEIAIFDINGIKVGTISNNELKKGINNFTYSTENLISGVYIVRAIGLNVNESVKINIVK